MSDKPQKPPCRHKLLISLVLIIATIAVFWQVGNHDFVNYDDNRYVTENKNVQAGVTRQNIKWAFTTTYANFWHPLTWLSYMLDCQLFGLKPGMHHLSNLLLHTANSVLLFLVFRRMTGGLWRSAFLAALFAVHPLHVESVAWIAQRKDTLSTLFWFLTMWSYVWYVEGPGVNRYLLVLLVYILGLMAKPMLVTLPFVLVLLDFWPLGRFQLGELGGDGRSSQQRSVALRLFWEKTPLFAVAAASSIVAFVAQKGGGAIGSLDKYPLAVRITNALASYATYMGKMIWPHHLAVHYPHPGTVRAWLAVWAGLLLIGVSVIVFRKVRRHPYLAVGWLWYLGTLVPVIGLVQVGVHAMADRYTYVPLVGLFIIVSWGAADVTSKWRYKKSILLTSATLGLSTLMILTWIQLHNWQSSISLFTHALQVTSDNFVAHNNIGNVLARAGNFDDAMFQYLEALQINPHYSTAHLNIANVLTEQGNLDEAITHYKEALRINPNIPNAHFNFANALVSYGKLEQAIYHLSEQLRIDPSHELARNNLRHLELVLANKKKLKVFPSQDLEGSGSKREEARSFNNLGINRAAEGKLGEAVSYFLKAVSIDPDYAGAHYNLGLAFYRQRKLDRAIEHYSKAVQINPNHAVAHYDLGNVLALQGRFEEAVEHYSEAIRINPNYNKAKRNLKIAMEMLGKNPEESE